MICFLYLVREVAYTAVCNLSTVMDAVHTLGSTLRLIRNSRLERLLRDAARALCMGITISAPVLFEHTTRSTHRRLFDACQLHVGKI